MKIRKSSFISLLLLQVFILTSATSVLANSRRNLDLDSQQGEFFKANVNSQAVIFKIGSTDLPLDSNKEYRNFPQIAFLHASYEGSYTKERSKKLSFSGFQFNSRNLLETQIFPFHFFW